MQKPVVLVDTLREGWLSFKRIDADKKSDWKRRYFSIGRRTLDSFRREVDTIVEYSLPLRGALVIPLASNVSIQIPSSISRECVFQVFRTDTSPTYFAAETSAEAAVWVRALRSAVDLIDLEPEAPTSPRGRRPEHSVYLPGTDLGVKKLGETNNTPARQAVSRTFSDGVVGKVQTEALTSPSHATEGPLPLDFENAGVIVDPEKPMNLVGEDADLEAITSQAAQSGQSANGPSPNGSLSGHTSAMAFSHTGKELVEAYRYMRGRIEMQADQTIVYFPPDKTYRRYGLHLVVGKLIKRYPTLCSVCFERCRFSGDFFSEFADSMKSYSALVEVVFRSTNKIAAQDDLVDLVGMLPLSVRSISLSCVFSPTGVYKLLNALAQPNASAQDISLNVVPEEQVVQPTSMPYARIHSEQVTAPTRNDEIVVSKFRAIRLMGHELRAVQVDRLSGIVGLLEVLDVSNSMLDDESVWKLLEALAESTQLRHLSLAGNRITKLSRDHLSQFALSHSTLKSLNLSRNRIGSGLDDLFEILGSSHQLMMALDVSYNRMSHESVFKLSRMLQSNRSLAFLDIAGNRFVEESGRVLSVSVLANHSLLALVVDHPRKSPLAVSSNSANSAAGDRKGRTPGWDLLKSLWGSHQGSNRKLSGGANANTPAKGTPATSRSMTHIFASPQYQTLRTLFPSMAAVAAGMPLGSYAFTPADMRLIDETCNRNVEHAILSIPRRENVQDSARSLDDVREDERISFTRLLYLLHVTTSDWKLYGESAEYASVVELVDSTASSYTESVVDSFVHDVAYRDIVGVNGTAIRHVVYMHHLCTQIQLSRSADIAGGSRQSNTFSGYMFKRGARRHNWKRRWFVLHGLFLYYYLSQENKKRKGMILLERAVARPAFGETAGWVSASPTDVIDYNSQRSSISTTATSVGDRTSTRGPTTHSFELLTPNRTYLLTCDSAADMEAWIATIRRSQDVAVRKQSSMVNLGHLAAGHRAFAAAYETLRRSFEDPHRRWTLQYWYPLALEASMLLYLTQGMDPNAEVLLKEIREMFRTATVRAVFLLSGETLFDVHILRAIEGRDRQNRVLLPPPSAPRVSHSTSDASSHVPSARSDLLDASSSSVGSVSEIRLAQGGFDDRVILVDCFRQIYDLLISSIASSLSGNSLGVAVPVRRDGMSSIVSVGVGKLSSICQRLQKLEGLPALATIDRQGDVAMLGVAQRPPSTYALLTSSTEIFYCVYSILSELPQHVVTDLLRMEMTKVSLSSGTITRTSTLQGMDTPRESVGVSDADSVVSTDDTDGFGDMNNGKIRFSPVTGPNYSLDGPSDWKFSEGPDVEEMASMSVSSISATPIVRRLFQRFARPNSALSSVFHGEMRELCPSIAVARDLITQELQDLVLCLWCIPSLQHIREWVVRLLTYVQWISQCWPNELQAGSNRLTPAGIAQSKRLVHILLSLVRAVTSAHMPSSSLDDYDRWSLFSTVCEDLVVALSLSASDGWPGTDYECVQEPLRVLYHITVWTITHWIDIESRSVV